MSAWPGLLRALGLLIISGQLKTMAGEIVAIWIVDGYLVGHTLLLARRQKPVFLFGAAIGMLIANLVGDETLYVALSFTVAGMVETSFAALVLPNVKTARICSGLRRYCVSCWAHASLLPPSQESSLRCYCKEFSPVTRFRRSQTG